MAEFFDDYAPSGRAIGGQGLGAIADYQLHSSGDVAHTMSGRRMKLQNVKGGSRVPHMADMSVGCAKPKAMMHSPAQAMMGSLPTTHGIEDVKLKMEKRRKDAERMKRGVEEMPAPMGGAKLKTPAELRKMIEEADMRRKIAKQPTTGRAMPPASDKRKARGDMIRKLMKEKGMTLPEASRHIKENALI